MYYGEQWLQMNSETEISRSIYFDAILYLFTLGILHVAYQSLGVYGIKVPIHATGVFTLPPGLRDRLQPLSNRTEPATPHL